VRESGLYSYVLMDGMIAQTLGPSSGIVDGVDTVLELGLAPLLNPEKCPFAVQKFRAHKTNASVFVYQGTMYVYSLGTAAAVNTATGDNAWVKLLCDLVVAYRPFQLYVANFSRLLRSADWAGQLMKALETACTVVDASGHVIDVNTGHGRMMWQMLAMASDFERDMIRQRLFAGMVNKHSRGQWIHGPDAVPPGYKLVDDRIVLDDTQVEAVRQLIHLLADSTLSDRQVLDAAGVLGLSSSKIRRLYGEDATYTEVKRSGPKVKALTRHLTLWRTGELETRIPSPYRGVTRIRGLDIVDPDPPRHHGYAVFRYKLEVPRGGWASDDIFDRAAGRPEARAATLGRRGATRRRRRPLSGWATCIDDAGRTQVITGTGAHYIVVRHDPEPT
jgi:DNA invertase Pin-like site-specific DNA recombinase